MKKLFEVCALGALAAVGAGLLVSGCKSTPELGKDTAQALIQAQYDQQPAGVTITVGDAGLKQGLAAGYWKLTKVYPNNRWADYTLTPDGKKVLKLAGGGDVIQWRPEQQDSTYSFLIVTLATNPLRAKDLQDPQDDVVSGATAAKSVTFTESVNMTGVPQPLQDIAHNAGNKLSSKKQAELTYDGMNWKLHGIV
ncbi:MAG TPA: hypothetical protein VG267_11765 [Terracidiphilus sp.]|nr:hypothetical protein [Terracidiphilus sp.]